MLQERIRTSMKGFEGAVTLPEKPAIFHRDQSIPQDIAPFSSGIKDIVVVPVRAELTKQHLAEYLTIINKQTSLDEGNKVGLVFLVNDHAGDQKNTKLLKENEQTARFLSYLAKKELPPNDLNIPQKYKDVAEIVVTNDALEVKYDYIHMNQDHTNFGALRLHLIELAGSFKNELVPDSEAVLHFHDVDAKLRKTHLKQLREAYEQNPNLLYNLSEFDLIPGTHEDAIDEDQDISREVLLHLDDYRLYQYGKIARLFLLGTTFSDITTQSGRFSLFFKNGFVNRQIAYTLEGTAFFDDYLMSNAAIRHIENKPDAIGNYGEIAFLHRARTTDISAEEALAGPDGEEVYAVVSQKAFKRDGFKRKYDLLIGTDADQYIDDLEEQTAKVNNSRAVQKGHSSDYLNQSVYQNILEAELQVERDKVTRRRERLLRFIEFQAYGSELHPDVERTLAPFIQYFSEEVDFIKEQIHSVHSPDEIPYKVDDTASQIIAKYDSFFNPGAKIHQQIARVRALKKYVFALGINMVELTKEKAISTEVIAA